MRVHIYILRRFLLAIPMFFIVITSVFVVMHIVPGDPVAVMYPQAPPSVINELKHLWGLDRPLYEQYASYISGLFRGDLGTSYFTREPVVDELYRAYPATIEIVIPAMLLSVALGIPLGMLSALKRSKFPDHLIRGGSLLAFSIPPFLLGLLLQFLLGSKLRILPIEGRISLSIHLTRITGLLTLDSILTGNFPAFVDAIAHLVMPALVLAAIIAPLISRVSRGSMLEELDEDYIITARSMGISEAKVISRHAFRNAVMPVFTVIGLYTAILMGGAVITETIFNYPGMGKLLLNSMLWRDYNLIQGCVTLYAISVIVITTLIDIIYAFLDPRVST